MEGHPSPCVCTQPPSRAPRTTATGVNPGSPVPAMPWTWPYSPSGPRDFSSCWEVSLSSEECSTIRGRGNMVTSPELCPLSPLVDERHKAGHAKRRGPVRPGSYTVQIALRAYLRPGTAASFRGQQACSQSDRGCRTGQDSSCLLILSLYLGQLCDAAKSSWHLCTMTSSRKGLSSDVQMLQGWDLPGSQDPALQYIIPAVRKY